jgi:hypothetical protein
MTERRDRFGILLGTFVFVLAACGVAAAPTPSPTAIPSPTPTPVPGAGGVVGGGGSGSGGSGGSGIGVAPPPGGVPRDPNLGQAQLVAPQPGQKGLHPVSVVLARAAVDGHHVSIELRWWSGVAPCSVLDSVQVQRDGATFTLTPMEGSSGRPVACEDIAQLKATVVDLGELDPGTYTIKASGDAPAITVTVS